MPSRPVLQQRLRPQEALHGGGMGVQREDPQRTGDDIDMRPVDPLPPTVRLFHIGPQKTGTTALQTAAAARRSSAVRP